MSTSFMVILHPTEVCYWITQEPSISKLVSHPLSSFSDVSIFSNFVVWTSAASNKHYLVALASLMVVLSLAFQPLAAALLVVKDTWLPEPGTLLTFIIIMYTPTDHRPTIIDVTLKNLAALGLNQNLQFNDLTCGFCL